MAPSHVATFKLLLLTLLGSTIAAPIVETRGELVQPIDLEQPADLESRGELLQPIDLEQSAGLEPEKRQTQNNPIQLNVDVSNWQDIAEENCFAMLCRYNGQRVWQRIATQATGNSHYIESGAYLTPFQSGSLASRHTSQIDSTTVSAEEFPWRSMVSGGAGAHLFPATSAQQNRQGGSINGAYRSNHVNYGDWFRITFLNYDTNRVYCPALFSNPPDTSVCTKKAKTTLFSGFSFPGVYDFVKVAGSNPIIFKNP
ncbi:hypothetical protein AAE478_006815 [Parahypoxylon ruwenzoriense]